MKNNLKAETLDKIIAEYNKYANLIIERKELLQGMIFGKGKFADHRLYPSEKDGRVVATQLSILNGKLAQLNKVLLDMISSDLEAKKFQNSLEKSEGVLSVEEQKDLFAQYGSFYLDIPNKSE